MARGHLIVVLWLGVAAASSKSAASERRADASEARDSRRLSKEDHRTFRGKLDPPVKNCRVYPTHWLISTQARDACTGRRAGGDEPTRPASDRNAHKRDHHAQ